MSDFTTPKKVNINEQLNTERMDSGNYSRYERKNNSYKPTDFDSFREQQQQEAFKRVQNAIYYKGKDKMPPPSGPQIMEDLRNARDSRRTPWGGKKKSYSKRKKLSKHSKRNKKNKTKKYYK
jgi:hypothetical protein